MAETINLDVTEAGFRDDVMTALAEHGLRAEIVDGDAASLKISFADDERERLISGAIHAIEAFLSDRLLPLVVQRANGGVVVRPPAE